jgi:hypothetical protein
MYNIIKSGNIYIITNLLHQKLNTYTILKSLVIYSVKYGPLTFP